MVLTTPVEMHTTLSAKNAYALVHARICNGAEASLPWKLLQTYLESCASIVQAVVCCPLLPPPLLSRPNPSPDAVRSRNPSKFTLTHDTVAATVLHKHHSIIRVGVDLIQFVYGSPSRLATELMHQRILFSPWFLRAFPNIIDVDEARRRQSPLCARIFSLLARAIPLLARALRACISGICLRMLCPCLRVLCACASLPSLFSLHTVNVCILLWSDILLARIFKLEGAPIHRRGHLAGWRP